MNEIRVHVRRRLVVALFFLGGTIAAHSESGRTPRTEDPPAERNARVVLARFGDLVIAKDIGAADEFSKDGIFVGSDAGEIAIGRGQIKSLFKKMFSGPNRISWKWQSVHAIHAGDVVWFFAEGEIVVAEPTQTVRMPYRLAGVIQRTGGRWVWRQFNGSEPPKG